MIPYNFHTHTTYSDGSNKPEDYITEAINQGFRAIGFSEHSVLPFENTFALKPEKVSEYCTEIENLKQRYKGQIEIWLAMEADYIPHISSDFQAMKTTHHLDYIIGSVHLVRNPAHPELWFIDGPLVQTYDDGLQHVFDGNIKKAVTAYWHQINRMIETETFDVIGHLDKIKMHNRQRWFSESDQWYVDLINETIDLIAENDLLVEVNTRGLYKGRSDSLFPGTDIITKLNNKGIKIILSSDAHQPHELSLWFSQAVEIIKSCGFTSTCIFKETGWEEVDLE